MSITLSADLEERLEALAQKTGQSKDSFAEEAILEHISDLEALYSSGDCLTPEHEGGSGNGLTNQVSALRVKWNEALADDSEGLDPEPVFERLETKYNALAESLTH